MELQIPLVAILVCIFSIIQNVIGQKDSIPVLIWESSRLTTPDTPIPALKKLDNAQFHDYLSKKLNIEEKPLILIFVEDNLSLEDFNSRDAENHIYFQQLDSITSKAGKVSFLPAVQSPLKVLKSFRNSPIKEINHKDLYKDSYNLNKEDINIIHLNNAADDEDRPDMLKEHDTIISDIYNRILTKFPKILSIYTGKYPSWVISDETSRRKRDTSNREDGSVFWEGTSDDQTERVLFYFKTGVLFNGVNINLAEDYTLKPLHKDKNDWRLPVRYPNFTLYFRFILNTDKYWTMKIEYQSTVSSTEKMTFVSQSFTAPESFGYHCSQNVTFRQIEPPNDKYILMGSLQVQPYLDGKTEQFTDDVFDCVSFFTAGIWSGLVVSFLLAAILLWGLTMIMDINTNDRFDDPKGKTITISATD